ncbi:uncharacterized protein C8R40DRAFT_610885 [Lentinula edodes]|uniref:uncharacterized protein n=1 Tax=Lentinula edodes TaxID=5353 RepID=UPI001E8D395B|nr:uncharacterized protein C8R40DRAFT_610885 [Lentinula edodes]KAH7871066.1 hypothetical protein C8R40DRAFT_610885 [Lentinula edodes]
MPYLLCRYLHLTLLAIQYCMKNAKLCLRFRCGATSHNDLKSLHEIVSLHWMADKVYCGQDFYVSPNQTYRSAKSTFRKTYTLQCANSNKEYMSLLKPYEGRYFVFEGKWSLSATITVPKVRSEVLSKYKDSQLDSRKKSYIDDEFSIFKALPEKDGDSSSSRVSIGCLCEFIELSPTISAHCREKLEMDAYILICAARP